MEMKPMTKQEQRELIKVFTRLRHINAMLAKLKPRVKIALAKRKK